MLHTNTRISIELSPLSSVYRIVVAIVITTIRFLTSKFVSRFLSVYMGTLMVIVVATTLVWPASLQWRHTERDGISNNSQPHDCLLNRLFRRRSKKHQRSASLAFVRWIHRWRVNSPPKWPVTRKMFPFDNDIMQRWGIHIGMHLCWNVAVYLVQLGHQCTKA